MKKKQDIIYVGIDPGLNGYMAILDSMTSPTLHPLPIMTIKDVQSGRRRIDAKKLIQLFPQEDFHVVIERQWPQGTGSRKAICTMCANYDRILVTMDLMGISYTEVTPTEWQKHFNISESGLDHKNRNIEVAEEHFPSVLIDQHDKADALLIGLYGVGKRL